MNLELPMPVAPKLNEVVNITVTGRVRNIRYDPTSPSNYTIWVDLELLEVNDKDGELKNEGYWKRDRFVPQQGTGSIDT